VNLADHHVVSRHAHLEAAINADAANRKTVSAVRGDCCRTADSSAQLIWWDFLSQLKKQG